MLVGTFSANTANHLSASRHNFPCQGNTAFVHGQPQGLSLHFSAKTHIFSSVMFSIFAMHFGKTMFSPTFKHISNIYACRHVFCEYGKPFVGKPNTFLVKETQRSSTNSRKGCPYILVQEHTIFKRYVQHICNAFREYNSH